MSEEITFERVRPCGKCGALLSFQAERCPECGAALPGVPGEDQRIECCLACGVMVPYGTPECPECGSAVRIPFDGNDEQVKSCVHCGELVTFADVYCMQCGNLTTELDVPEIPPKVDYGSAPRGWEGAVDRGSLVILVGALGALAATAVLLLRSV